MYGPTLTEDWESDGGGRIWTSVARVELRDLFERIDESSARQPLNLKVLSKLTERPHRGCPEGMSVSGSYPLRILIPTRRPGDRTL